MNTHENSQGGKMVTEMLGTSGGMRPCVSQSEPGPSALHPIYNKVPTVSHRILWDSDGWTLNPPGGSEGILPQKQILYILGTKARAMKDFVHL